MLLPLTALLFSVTLTALTVSVSDTAGRGVAGATISAEPAGSEGKKVEAISNGDGSATLSLAAGRWRLRASRPESWCWPVEVTVPGGPVRLELLPAARVSGRLARPPGEPSPPAIQALVTPALDARTWLAPPIRDRVACPLVGERWACPVPAATLVDLELKLPGFAPLYVRGMTVAADESQHAGTQAPFRGGSAAGWIVEGRGEAVSAPSKVRLAPVGGSAATKAVREVVGDTGRRGFFQIGPIEPGVYKAIAGSERGVSLSVPVNVEADKETRLLSPLVVQPAAALSVTVSPPEDPEAKPWRIRLVALRGPSRATIEAEEPIGPDGRWSRERLPAGRYHLNILRADGSSWHNERLALEPGENHLDVTPGLMRVTGSVSLGAEPLKAALILGDRSARVSASFESGEDGSFQGSLPRLDVETARWFVRVRARDPETSVAFEGVTPATAAGDKVHFVLTIPDGSIGGAVVDETGAPQQATVIAQPVTDRDASLQASEPFQSQSDPNTGAFVMRGLVPGDYGVFARAYRPSASEGSAKVLLESDVSIVSVHRGGSTGGDKGLSLVLRTGDAISGRVRTPDGVGVPDATVFAIPTQAPSNPVRRALTDAQGRFSADVPANTSSVIVLIEAVGVGRRATRQATSKDEPLDLVLDPESSGILLLESDPAVDYGNVFVYHDGALDGLRALERWAQAHGDFGEGQVRAPFMSPGFYRVCVPRGVMEAFRMMTTSLPTDQCAEGDLRPGGELRLTVPLPPAAP